MKLLNSLKSAFAFITMFSIVATSCTAQNKNPETQAMSQEIAAEVKTNEINNSDTIDVKDSKVKVAQDSIYDEDKVKAAICPYSDPELAKFVLENAMFENMGKINANGIIKADLIIEKNGLISDVLIVEGLHPTIDKEAIRAIKLLPNFNPAKLKGKTVRSKYRMIVSVRTSFY